MWSLRRMAAAMPRNAPQAKNAVVACWSHSHGWPMVRVSTSRNTHSVKLPMHTPHETMSTASTRSSALHLRCRWRWMTSARYTAKLTGELTRRTPSREGRRRRSAPPARPARRGVPSLHVADETQDLDRMRAELLGELVLDGQGGLLEAGLVDLVDHLHADLLQLVGRFLLELERHGRLALGDFVGRRLHPLLLLDAQAVPGLVADPQAVVVGLVLGHAQDRRDFVVLVLLVDVDAVLGDVHHAGLQARIHLAEGHVDRLGAVGGEVRVLGLGRLDADLLPLDVLDLGDLLLRVHVAEAHGEKPDHLPALDGVLDHGAESFG